eukprot:2256692-Rhodomonas_salina.1
MRTTCIRLHDICTSTLPRQLRSERIRSRKATTSQETQAGHHILTRRETSTRETQAWGYLAGASRARRDALYCEPGSLSVAPLTPWATRGRGPDDETARQSKRRPGAGPQQQAARVPSRAPLVLELATSVPDLDQAVHTAEPVLKLEHLDRSGCGGVHHMDTTPWQAMELFREN